MFWGTGKVLYEHVGNKKKIEFLWRGLLLFGFYRIHN